MNRKLMRVATGYIYGKNSCAGWKCIDCGHEALHHHEDYFSTYLRFLVHLAGKHRRLPCPRTWAVVRFEAVEVKPCSGAH